MQRHYYQEYYVVEESHWWFRARRQIIRDVLEQAGLWGYGLRMLDVGCGTGRMLEFLCQGLAVTGIESEMEALRFAASLGCSRLVQSDARRLPIRDCSFDVVSAFDLLEHLEDERVALEEFRRVLKPGGHCVVTVPALRFLWSEHDEVNLHLRRYRRRRIRQCFTEAGFQVTRCSYFNTLLFPPIAAVRIGRRLLSGVVNTSRRDSAGRLRSDFSLLQMSGLGGFFEYLMGLEGNLLRRFDLPVGVSILGVARRPNIQLAGRYE